MLYNDKAWLVLSHHTDFLFLLFQSVSKGIDILQSTVPVFTNVMGGLGRDVRLVYYEQINNGFSRNRNHYAALDSFDLSITLAKWPHSYFEAFYSQVCNGLHRFN